MIESALAPLRDFAGTVRWADVVDVLLAAGFFFVVIRWLRRSVSRGALIVVSAIAVVYILARLMNLYLMEMLIRGLLVVFLLASVVVFQADIRRFIDRVGAWSRSSGRGDSSSAAVDLLTEAAFHMGDERTGALIAVRGHEPWERHVEGGVGLGGRVSLPLLYSLFHHHSPGHDGAMLLEGETIETFGAHLSLSTNLPPQSPYGTRHAAALGLSEECDAFVIVVSEERGEVSVARGGRLEKMESASDLKRKLKDFWVKHYEDGAEGARPAWWNRRTLQTAALSVGLAALAWLLFAHQSETVYRTTEVPVEFRNLPDDWVMDEPDPAIVQVTLSGPAQAFRLFDLSDLVLSFDLEDATAGAMELTVEENNLNLPDNINLYRVDPGSVRIEAQQIRSVELPVRVRTSGAVADSLELVRLVPEPRTVTLHVPLGLAVPEQVDTRPLNLQQVTSETPVRVRLLLPPKTSLPTGNRAEVVVRPHLRSRDADTGQAGDEQAGDGEGG